MSSDKDLHTRFLAAARFVAKCDTLKPSNDQKLQFYGLYKQGSEVRARWQSRPRVALCRGRW